MPILPPVKVGDMAIIDLRLYQVIDIDNYGFCILADIDGETIVRHQSHWELENDFLRATAEGCC